MDYKTFLQELQDRHALIFLSVAENYNDEIYLSVRSDDFKKTCVCLHKLLHSPVAVFFAQDSRREKNAFVIYCTFMSAKYKKWFFVSTEIAADKAILDSLAREIYSSSLFEREVREMFGIEFSGSPDARSLRLHEEVWPRRSFPLRKDFQNKPTKDIEKAEYNFNKVDGEGILEVPVGPVHAGIIAPGHFRFSVAGEPIINLEIRLGFKHKGIEKLFEGKNVFEAIKISERISGDSSFAHSLAYTQAIEKICGIIVTESLSAQRAICLELERMYNHANDMGGIALDVGFSFPAALASLIKEEILQLNEKLTGSRFLRGVNEVGTTRLKLDEGKKKVLLAALKKISKDFGEIKKILLSSASFMDRVDGTGVLKKKTAEDFGVVGLAARASGIAADLRKDFSGIYTQFNFNPAKEATGDVLARLNIRIFEVEESIRLIEEFINIHHTASDKRLTQPELKEGFALGYVEAWRGPVLYWIKIDENGLIERCKVVDPSFHNWQGLSYCVLGDIIPDFPLCNKSFDLSYSGNDL